MTSGCDPLTAVDRLVTASTDGTVGALVDRLGLRLLGVFGSAARQHRFPDPSAPAPHDVDVMASFAGRPRLLQLIDALVVLTGCDAIDVAVIDGADPVLRAEAMVGIGLYEREPGAYATTQMAAFAERRDTAHLRHLSLEALRR
jgi:predicted nucleotidyltransferase